MLPNKHITRVFFLFTILLNAVSLAHAQQRWTSDTLLEDRFNINTAVAGDKIFYFTGRNRSGGVAGNVISMEIHNTRTGNKQLLQVPDPDSLPGNMGIAAKGAVTGVIGSKVYFAGGDYGNTTKKVSIYDTTTKQWSYTEMPTPKNYAAGAVYNNKLFIGGGRNTNGSNEWFSTMNIFNPSNNSWQTKNLISWGEGGPTSRTNLAAITINNKVIFAGGRLGNTFSKKVNIYNTVSGNFLEESAGHDILLSDSTADLGSFIFNNKAWFVGGESKNQVPSYTIDIYNPQTNTWDTMEIPTLQEMGVDGRQPIYNRGVVQAGSKMFLLHQPTLTDPRQPDSVTIYDLERDTWQVKQVPGQRYASTMVKCKDNIYFAGGLILNSVSSSNYIAIYNLYPQLGTFARGKDTSSYDFGKVHLQKEQQDSTVITLRNTGDYRLLFSPDKVSISGSQQGAFALDTTMIPDTLAPAQAVEMPVVFTPADTTLHEASLTFHSNDSTAPNKTFALQGKGTEGEPSLAVTINGQAATSLDFGSVPLNKDSTVSLQVRNTGDYKLTFDTGKVSLSGSGLAHFSADTTTLPDVLPAGQSVTLPLTFAPSETGTHQVSLTFHSDDPDNGEFHFNVTGTGEEPSGIPSVDKAASIEVFPNPVQEVLHIRLPENSSGGRFHLSNTAGQKVMTGKLKGRLTAQDLSGIAPGYYILVVRVNGTLYRKAVSLE